MKRLKTQILNALVFAAVFVPTFLFAATAADDLIGLGMSPQLADYLTTKLMTLNSSGNIVIPVASGKKLSVTVAGTEEIALDGTTLTLGSNNIALTSGDLISSAASKGMIAGEATRAAAVTTATTAAAPFYVSGAAASYDLTAYIGTGATASGPVIDHFKTRATTGAASTIVASGDALGTLKFWGANGTTYDPAASIIATVDATPGASADMPGALDFQLSPDGSATLASVMKLKNSGQIQVSKAQDINFNLSGGTIAIQEATGANACSGTVTANATTPVVTSTTCATTGSRIFLTKTANSTVNGSCFISALSTGVSFSITCLATDTGAYNWFIVHEAV